MLRIPRKQNRKSLAASERTRFPPGAPRSGEPELQGFGRPYRAAIRRGVPPFGTSTT